MMLLFVREFFCCLAARPGFEKFLGPPLPMIPIRRHPNGPIRIAHHQFKTSKPFNLKKTSKSSLLSTQTKRKKKHGPDPPRACRLGTPAGTGRGGAPSEHAAAEAAAPGNEYRCPNTSYQLLLLLLLLLPTCFMFTRIRQAGLLNL
jgi:hypothetical protein